MKKFIIIILMILAALSDIYSQDSWVRTNGLENIIIYSLAVNSNGDIFAGADTTHDEYRSTDNGITWTNLGLDNLKTTGIIIKPSGEILLSTLDHNLHGGIFHSTDNGDSWTNMGYAGASTAIALNSNGNIFAGTLGSGIFRSTDNGASWAQINQGLSDPHIISLIINSSNGYIFTGTYSGVFRSTDNGDNWVQVNQGITNNQILSLAINSGGDVFAGTSGGGVFRSTNNGDSWVEINQGLAGEALYVRSLLINSNGVVLAGAAGGIFRSDDNGANWVEINQGLTRADIFSLAINSNSVVFAGTSDGIFRSLFTLPVELTSFAAKIYDQDKVKLNWKTETEVNNYGFDIERQTDDGQWEKVGFVNGNGNSNSPKEYSYIDKNLTGGSKFLYRLKQVDNDGQFEYSSAVEVELVPNKYELSQNYPNPFNPSTKIRYQLPNASKVVIKIYNILGSEVMELVNEQKAAGSYEAEFNASNLSSGTYIYKIIANNFVQTKKMILLK